MRAPELSIVVPVHDEADNVGPLIAELRAALAAESFEVVFVDDASTDATFERLLAARREVLPGLRILRHGRRAGQSAAIRSGVAAARAPWIVTLDGDRQNDPADIHLLLAARDAAAPPVDLVLSRRARRRDRWHRRVASQIANAARSAILGDGVRDTGAGLKLFRRATFLDLPAFDHMHRFLPALFAMVGARYCVVTVSHRPRVAGRSKYGIASRLIEGIIDLMGVLWLRRRTSRPPVTEIAVAMTAVTPSVGAESPILAAPAGNGAVAR